MTSGSPAGCARCATILDQHFRFCPECGLPASGATVMSTDIADLSRRVAATSARRQSHALRRYLLPTAAIVMFTFVVVLGLVLFDRPLLDKLLPATPLREPKVPHAPRWEPEWIAISPGVFPFGDPAEGRQGEVTYAYRIAKHEVPNSLWLDYLTAERTRIEEINLWQESFPSKAAGWSIGTTGKAQLLPERRPYPVTDITPVAIAEFCAWLTRRLADPAWEIRIPTQLEWEYAARGKLHRAYTWGDGDVMIPIPRSQGNTRPRAGIDSSAYPVDDAQLADDDTSPWGVVAMGTNVSEWTLMPDFDFRPNTPEIELPEFLAVSILREKVEQRQLNVALRGASVGCDAELARRFARPWWKLNSEPRNAQDDVGIRLVKVKAAN